MARPKKIKVVAPPEKAAAAAEVQDQAVVADSVVADSAALVAEEAATGDALPDAGEGAPIADEKPDSVADSATVEAPALPVVEPVAELEPVDAEEVQAADFEACSYLLTNLSPARVSVCRLSVDSGKTLPVDICTSTQLNKIRRTVDQLNELSARNGHGERLVFEKA